MVLSTSSAVVAIGLGAVVFGANAIRPRETVAQEHAPAAAVTVACFEREALANFPGDRCEPQVEASLGVLLDPHARPRPFVEAVLDGLEDLAIASDDQNVRISAITWLSSIGFGGESGPAWPGIVDRLERVYRETDDPNVQRAAVIRARGQAEEGAAVRFLARVAQDDRPRWAGLHRPPAYEAVHGLLHIGSEGRAALRRLYAEGGVSNADARARLEFIARKDFDPARAG